TGFLAIFTTLSLSQRSGILSSFTPKSKRVCFIYRIWAQHAPAAIYSASAVDKATEFCFLLDQETRERPSKWQPPEVLLRSTRLPAKSESEYPKRSKLAPLGYHKPMLRVCLRYRRILWVCLKAGTQAHTKHYIGPRCGKVKQRPYQRTIEGLINRFTVHIQVEMPIGCHGWQIG